MIEFKPLCFIREVFSVERKDPWKLEVHNIAHTEVWYGLSSIIIWIILISLDITEQVLTGGYTVGKDDKDDTFRTTWLLFS